MCRCRCRYVQVQVCMYKCRCAGADAGVCTFRFWGHLKLGGYYNLLGFFFLPFFYSNFFSSLFFHFFSSSVFSFLFFFWGGGEYCMSICIWAYLEKWSPKGKSQCALWDLPFGGHFSRYFNQNLNLSAQRQHSRPLPLDTHPTCLCLGGVKFSLFNGWAPFWGPFPTSKNAFKPFCWFNIP